jgi:RNA polymerase sigma-70 factor (ECF subfamily)
MITGLGRNSGTFDTPRRLSAYDRDAEQQLVRACRAGERGAQEDFYRRYRRQVAATLYRVLNDRNELEDLTQDVFIIAFRGLDKFRGDARVSTWLYRICVNVALGKIRTKVRKPPPIPMEQPVVESVADSPETPERTLRRNQDRDRVHRLLAAMPAKKRIVLFLHEIEGRDLKEIAEIVGAHPVTVRTRLFYARKEFYERLAQDAES